MKRGRDAWNFEEATPTTEQETFEPQRAPNMHADVWVPAGEAFLSGVAIGLGAIVVALLLRIDEQTTDPRTWAMIFIVPFTATLIGMWFKGLDWARETVYKVESWTGQDLTRDGIVGDPDSMHPIVTNARAPKPVPGDSEKQMRLRLQKFVDTCYREGHDVRTLRRAGYTDTQIEQFRNVLIMAGAAEWDDETHKGGWHFARPRPEVIRAADNIRWLPAAKKR